MAVTGDSCEEEEFLGFSCKRALVLFSQRYRRKLTLLNKSTSASGLRERRGKQGERGEGQERGALFSFVVGCQC